MSQLQFAAAQRVRTETEWSITQTLRNISSFGSKRPVRKTSNDSNPTSLTEAPSITSKWGIGWQTPTLMAVCYFLALIIAIAHLLLFRFLDGREANGPNKVASQSFITTTSNGLAILFGISLRTSLAIAFCQHLWRLLRLSTMKVSLIENLFSIRANPFLLLKATVLKATPSLCICVVIMLASQIVTAFPPGAINVVGVFTISNSIVSIPSFNASFMGNLSGVDANANSFTTWTPAPPDGIIPGKDRFSITSNNLINRIARQVLVSGSSIPVPSPCGLNCTYVTQFEGPYFQCSTTTTNYTYTQTSVFNQVEFAAYTGSWDSGLTPPPGGNPLRPKTYNGTYTLATYNATVDSPLSIVVGDGPDGGVLATLRRDNITCLPGRATYTIRNTFTNNIQTTAYEAIPIDRLINLAIPTHDHVVIVPGSVAPNSTNLGTIPANWTAASTALYRDTNLMAIFGATLSWLNGNYTASLPTGNNFNLGFKNLSGTPDQPLSWLEAQGDTQNGVSFGTGESTAGVLIDSTRFNMNLNQLSTPSQAGPRFNITQRELNDYLFKVTTSLMSAYARWNTTTNATLSTPITIYTFSQPLNLILPYFVTLALSIPFILLGGFALVSNGVSAVDGGFIQLISTTTGSPALDQAAAGGCLGGSESVPQELKDIRIRFGELAGRDPGGVKLAGFGTEEEIMPLIQGERYGVAKWI